MLYISKVRRNVERWVARRPPQLLKVEVWPVAGCNLACRICGSWHGDQKQRRLGEITDDWLRSIVSECIELGAQEFLFGGGGEPWLRGNILLELMGDIKAAGRIGHLSTNGTLFSREDVKKIVSMGWDRVMLSIDGPSAGVHDVLRGKAGTFELVKTTLCSFGKEKQHSGTELPFLGINCVITNRNTRLVQEMVRFAAEHGCDEILFQALKPLTEEFTDFVLDTREQKTFITGAVAGARLARKLGVRTNLGDFSNRTILQESGEAHKILAEQTKELPGGLASIPCYEAWRGLSVTSEGRISICAPLAGRGQFRITHTGCREAWLGEDSEKIRRMMVSGDIGNICKGCCSNRLFENKNIRDCLRQD